MSNNRAAHIRCSECPAVVPNPSGKRLTCSDRCRTARSKRLNENQKRAGDLNRDTPAATEFKSAIGDKLDELVLANAGQLVQKEVADKLGEAVQRLTNLTPRAIARLELDLESGDPRIAQRAAELLLKYTVPVAGKEMEQGGDVNVQFNLPRPDDGSAPVVEGESTELRTCEMCSKEKPVSEFVDDSDRCETCHEDLRKLVEGRLGQEI